MEYIVIIMAVLFIGIVIYMGLHYEKSLKRQEKQGNIEARKKYAKGLKDAIVVLGDSSGTMREIFEVSVPVPNGEGETQMLFEVCRDILQGEAVEYLVKHNIEQ